MTKPKRAAGPPCVFSTTFMREVVDPRVAGQWPAKPVPYGDLRRTWRLQHCATVNPYWDSEMCPYPASECAMAFLSSVQSATVQGTRNPLGRFRAIAKLAGLRRLEDKPLARDRDIGPQRSGDAGAPTGNPGPRPPADDAARPGTPEDDLRRTNTRPSPIGEVLGALHLGPREVRPHDGQEGTI